MTLVHLDSRGPFDIRPIMTFAILGLQGISSSRPPPLGWCSLATPPGSQPPGVRLVPRKANCRLDLPCIFLGRLQIGSFWPNLHRPVLRHQSSLKGQHAGCPAPDACSEEVLATMFHLELLKNAPFRGIAEDGESLSSQLSLGQPFCNDSSA